MIFNRGMLEMEVDVKKLEVLAWDIIVTQARDSIIGSASMMLAVQILKLIYSKTKFAKLLKDMVDMEEKTKDRELAVLLMHDLANKYVFDKEENAE